MSVSAARRASRPSGPPVPRRYLVLAICCAGLLLAGMDNTIVNVALPSIRARLGASVAGLQWVTDAYTLVLGALLVLSGSLADRFGRKRVFLIGLLVFAAGSLLCGIAVSLGTLIVFRALQALPRPSPHQSAGPGADGRLGHGSRSRTRRLPCCTAALGVQAAAQHGADSGSLGSGEHGVDDDGVVHRHRA